MLCLLLKYPFLQFCGPFGQSTYFCLMKLVLNVLLLDYLVQELLLGISVFELSKQALVYLFFLLQSALLHLELILILLFNLNFLRLSATLLIIMKVITFHLLNIEFLNILLFLRFSRIFLTLLAD